MTQDPIEEKWNEDRKKEAIANSEALKRDAEKGYAIMQTSPRRFAVIRQSRLSWYKIQQFGSDCEKENWLTIFRYNYAKDSYGNDLKNLELEEAKGWYKQLMLGK
jgi:hypothetical protein